MTTEIRDAIRAAADAKAAYWDRMHELEEVLGCEDPPADINNLLVDRIDILAVSVDEPGDVDWISATEAGELTRDVIALADRHGLVLNLQEGPDA